MKIVFDKNVLLDALTPALSAVSTKKDNVVTECVRIMSISDEKCMISAFDGERGFQTEIECDVKKEGSYLFNAARLISIVRSMPLDVTIEVNDKMLAVISSGRSRFEIQCLEGSRFPTTPVLDSEYGFIINQSLFKKLISQTCFCAAENNQKLQLNGAYFVVKEESIKVVALDGFRFAERFEDCKIKSLNKNGSYLDVNFIITKKALGELMRLLSDGEEEIKILRGLKHIMFFKKNYIFYTRQIDGDYIDYNRFIPTEANLTVNVKAGALLEAFERGLLVTEDKDEGRIKGFVKLKFEPNLIKLTSVSTSNKIYEEIACVSDGDDLEIGFNCKLVTEALRALSEEEDLVLTLTTPLSCMCIRPADESKRFLYFVFPVRLRENN